jgi:hypothetical protein
MFRLLRLRLEWARIRGGRRIGFEGGPTGGWLVEKPNVLRRFQFRIDLEKLPNRVRALNPSDSRADVAELGTAGDLQRNPRVFGEVITGGVTATVKIETESRGAFLERLAEQVDTSNDNGQGLCNSFAAATLEFSLFEIHRGASCVPDFEPDDNTVAGCGLYCKYALIAHLWNSSRSVILYLQAVVVRPR